MERHSVKIAETGKTRQCLGDHKGSKEQSAVEYQRVIPQRLQEMPMKQTDKCPCSTASGAVEAEIGVEHTGRQGKMWQEHIVKQCPCHKTHSQKDTTQIK